MSEASQFDFAGVLLRALPPISLDKFMEESGLSQVSCYRMRQRGWLKTVVIGARHYVTRAAIAEFNERAERGEFWSGDHATRQPEESEKAVIGFAVL